MVDVILRRFETPDEVRQFPRGRFELVRIGDLTIGRATYEPGWRWSRDVGPSVGAERCRVEHVGLVLDEGSPKGLTVMKKTLALLASLALLGLNSAPQQPPAMSFFITSVGTGQGADLGGLTGADRHCQALADAAGARGRQWRAYLSAIPRGGAPAIHARDRIGSGPWFNAKGVKVADNMADLHGENNKLSKENSLTEKGAVVNGRGDQPNMHDILTGSQLDGTAYAAEGYTNCDNWTSSAEGSARVGHHDRVGGGENPTSWNSAHNSRGCSQANLQGTGGNGLFYCFALGR